MNVLRLSDQPAVTLRLGDPAMFRWEGADGYTEFEIGSVAADDEVVRDLAEFWAGRWRDWNYGFNNNQFVVSLEMEWENGRVWLRVDYHHMNTHLGIDWRVAVARTPDAELGAAADGGG